MSDSKTEPERSNEENDNFIISIESPKMDEHKFEKDARVWFTRTSAHTTPRKGRIMDKYWTASVTLIEPLVRFAVMLTDESDDEKNVKLAYSQKEGTVSITAPHGSIKDYQKGACVIYAGSVIDICRSEQPVIGSTVEVDVAHSTFNVGHELAMMVSGWTWLWSTNTVRTVVTAVQPKYRVVECVMDGDEEKDYEIYSGVSADEVSRRI